MPYIKGDNIRFSNNGVNLTLETSCTLLASNGTIDTKNKSSDLWKTSISGDKTWIMSAIANTDFNSAENISQTFNDFQAGIEVDVTMGDDNYIYSGRGIITSWEFSGERNAISKFNLSVKGSGLLTLGTGNFGYLYGDSIAKDIKDSGGDKYIYIGTDENVNAYAGVSTQLDFMTGYSLGEGNVCFIWAATGNTITINHQIRASSGFTTLTGSSIVLTEETGAYFIQGPAPNYYWVQQ